MQNEEVSPVSGRLFEEIEVLHLLDISFPTFESFW